MFLRDIYLRNISVCTTIVHTEEKLSDDEIKNLVKKGNRKYLHTVLSNLRIIHDSANGDLGLYYLSYGDENFSSSFLIDLIKGTAGSSGGSLLSVNMRLVSTSGRFGRWNGPALSGLEPQAPRE